MTSCVLTMPVTLGTRLSFLINPTLSELKKAVRDLCRTAFSSQCRHIAGSSRRRFVDRKLNRESVTSDGLGTVPAREKIIHFLILMGERKP